MSRANLAQRTWRRARRGVRTLLEDRLGLEVGRSEIALTCELLERRAIDTVLDVGANTGQFAARLLGSRQVRVLSFEPTIGPFTQLEAAAATNGEWTAHHFALAAQDGQQVIHTYADSSFNSLRSHNETFDRRFGYASREVKEETVALRRTEAALDELLGEPDGRRLFLKMDTQGYDLEVFAGLGRWRESVQMLQSELSLVPIYEGMPDWLESLRIFREAGFDVARLSPVTHDGPRVIEYDALLVRRQTNE